MDFGAGYKSVAASSGASTFAKQGMRMFDGPSGMAAGVDSRGGSSHGKPGASISLVPRISTAMESTQSPRDREAR